MLPTDQVASTSTSLVQDIAFAGQGTHSYIRKRNKISSGWKYFSKSNDKKLAKCSECGKEYKTCGNTTNLFDHLKRFHPHLTKNSQSLQLASASISTSHSEASSARSNTRSVSPFFRKAQLYDNNSLRKKSLDEALIMMICQDFQPFSIVKDEGFRKFVELLDSRYSLPNPDTLKNKLLKNMYDETSNTLKDILGSIKYVAITTDIWTSVSNESFICVSCHFVDSHFELKRVVLATNVINESKTAENIARVLKEIFDQWNIFDKISCIVTDNAANMLKACELLQKTHIPCFAHSLNLAVQENFKSNLIQPLLKKCKDVVTFFKSSPTATLKFKEEQRQFWRDTHERNKEPYKLLQEVPTRWNSCFYMIKRILLTSDPLNNTLLKLRNAPQPFSADGIAVMKDMEKCLSVFEDATEKVSGYKYVTISLLIPTVFGIYNFLSSCDLLTEIGLKFRDGLVESVRTRLFPYETRTVPRISTILDARFKKDGFKSIINAEQASCFLEQELGGIIHEQGQTNISDENSRRDTQLDTTKSNLFAFMEQRKKDKSRNIKADVIIIKRQYLERQNSAQETDPLLFWKLNEIEIESNPMQELAKKYLCIPGTSVESERNFSSAGQILTDRWSRLRAKYLNMIIFVNKNSFLMQ
ncbi:E3 SUMO-protein ligase ZBED1-like [Diabrotica undecimpunctata]|uniref:E3 SUMO-protein ligase ZBED1-like n=1 Tax=Diabrotica undecimpunctata TaxID=50387 RepID=UPI003B637BB8